jgi:cobalt/nickel transport system permease protein
MHISEGVLKPEILALGWAFTIGGTALGLRSLDEKKVVLAGLMSALFFTASLIHVPVGVGSAHLIFNGIIGLILGWGAFVSILIGLFFQAIFFQFGGLIVLGVNTFNIAFPAVISYYLFRNWIKKKGIYMYAGAFLSAIVSILGAGLLVSLELAYNGEKFIKTAELIFLIHIPIAIIEGIVYIFIIKFLNKVYPYFF